MINWKEEIMRKHEIGGLLIRLVLGVIFLVHGFMKFQTGFGKLASVFDSIHFPFPLLFAYGVGVAELLGGFCLIIGFTTRFISALFVLIMVGAIITVDLSKGFLGGYEFNLALLAMAFYLMVGGNNFLALDNRFIETVKRKRAQ